MSLPKAHPTDILDGIHGARISGVIDLGHHKTTNPGDATTIHKVGVILQLTGTRQWDGSPYSLLHQIDIPPEGPFDLSDVIHATLDKESPNKKALHELLDRPVLITVRAKRIKGQYSLSIESFDAVQDYMLVPLRQGLILLFWLDTPDPLVFDELPAAFQKLIETRVRSPDSANCEDATKSAWN